MAQLKHWWWLKWWWHGRWCIDDEKVLEIRPIDLPCAIVVLVATTTTTIELVPLGLQVLLLLQHVVDGLGLQTDVDSEDCLDVAQEGRAQELLGGLFWRGND